MIFFSSTLEVMRKRLAVLNDEMNRLARFRIDLAGASHHRFLNVDVFFLVETVLHVRLVRFVPAFDFLIRERDGFVQTGGDLVVMLPRFWPQLENFLVLFQMLFFLLLIPLRIVNLQNAKNRNFDVRRF